MGSSKKHKKDSKKHKKHSRSSSPREKRSRSYSAEDQERVLESDKHRKESSRYESLEKRHKKHRREKAEHRQTRRRHRYEEDNGQNSGSSSSRPKAARDRIYVEVEEDSDSSDCVEVPVDDAIPVPPPPITRRPPTPEPVIVIEESTRPSKSLRTPSPVAITRRSSTPPRVAPPRRRSPSPSRFAPPRRRSPSPPRFAPPRRRSPSPPRVAPPRRRSPSPPRVAPPRRRSPSPPRVAPPRRRSPSPQQVSARAAPPRRRSPSPPQPPSRAAPPPPPSRRRSPSPQLTQPRVASTRRRSPSPPPAKVPRRKSPSPEPPARQSSKQKSLSPIPENGAGDVLSIVETNKLRAKLGLKPLEVGPPDSSSAPPAAKRDETAPKNEKTGAAYEKIKDDWGEFYHKPATNQAEKTQEQKIREKLKERKEKRMVEEKLKKMKTLGEDEEMDDVKNWVIRNRDKERLRKEAEQRAKMLDQLDEEFGLGDLVDQEVRTARRDAYRDRDLQGLRVEHDVEEFKEGRQVILTLKDADVLDEEATDTLVNVNMVDDERYKKNVENKKQNPNHYGYDVYCQDEVDEFGVPIERDVLGKYNEEIGGAKKASFVLGSNAEREADEKRKQLEIKAKLQHKKLDSLHTDPLALASEYYTENEMASFKKPKKKVRKIRQKLKADDLLSSAPDLVTGSKDLGSRANRHSAQSTTSTSSAPSARRRDLLLTDDTPIIDEDLSNIKIEEDDEDLQAVLSKARRLKQKEAIISKALPVDADQIKSEIKSEMESEDEQTTYDTRTRDGAMLLNATAEFCRTLGDIPTYGLAGNRDEDVNEMMDFEEDSDKEQDVQEDRAGAWNSVNTEKELEEQVRSSADVDDIAILDEEPDVASSVAGALKLANSKGYLEREESNRPSNARFAHLQAQNYSIEDKNYGEDDKYSRRDRFCGPIMDFKEKETFKPNVKLEYIDDNGHLLTPKEAFRYLSHKFHGKGPGKNKVEKRLKKSEQEGLMKKMSSTDTPLGTLGMLQLKQKETQSPFVVLSGSKQNTSIVKHKR